MTASEGRRGVVQYLQSKWLGLGQTCHLVPVSISVCSRKWLQFSEFLLPCVLSTQKTAGWAATGGSRELQKPLGAWGQVWPQLREPHLQLGKSVEESARWGLLSCSWRCVEGWDPCSPIPQGPSDHLWTSSRFLQTRPWGCCTVLPFLRLSSHFIFFILYPPKKGVFRVGM